MYSFFRQGMVESWAANETAFVLSRRSEESTMILCKTALYRWNFWWATLEVVKTRESLNRLFGSRFYRRQLRCR